MTLHVALFFRQNDGHLTDPIIVNRVRRYEFINGLGFRFPIPRMELPDGSVDFA